MKSQLSAWKYLAECFAKADKSGNAHIYSADNDCLCHAISRMEERRVVSPGTLNNMFDAIDEEKVRTESGPYLYELSRSGAKRRASFCRRMVRKLERLAAKKKSTKPIKTRSRK